MNFDHPEHLLDHGQLVRSLAGALVHGAADVDDVVQGTYEAALGSARPAGFPLPRWLLGVARNVARRTHRDRRRRAAREQAVAQPESLRSTAEVVELEELRRLVVAAVLGLSEPQRSIVLLRYYDGLPPRAIAARLGLSAVTVRSHLHRALAALRRRLDREAHGGRARWAALLLPLAPVLATKGTASMTLKLALSTFAVATTALLYQALHTPSLAQPSASAVVDLAPVPSSGRERAADAAPRTDATPAVTAPDDPAREMPFASLRFVAADGGAVAGDDLERRFAAARTVPAVVVLDVDALERGGIEGMVATRMGDPAAWQQPRTLAFVAGGAEVRELPAHGRIQLLVARPGAPGHLSEVLTLPSAAPIECKVPMPPAADRRTVRFTTEDGAPLAGAQLVAYTEFGDDRAFVPGTTLVLDARGEATFTAVAPPNPRLIRPAIWWLETADHAVRVDHAAAEVVAQRRGSCEGTAMRLDGSPAADCIVAFARDKGPRFAVRTDAQGRFRLDGLCAGPGLLALLGKDTADLRSQGVAIRANDTLRSDFGAGEGGARVAGRVTAGGQPLAGVVVMAGKGRSGRRLVKTAADGGYQFDGIAAGARFAVLLGDPDVSDDFTIMALQPVEFAAGSAATLDFDLPGGQLRVRVLDADTGAPLEGIAVDARPAQDGVQADRFAGFRYRAGWAARTDAMGEVVLRALPEGEPHIVTAGGNGRPRATTGVTAPALTADAEFVVLRLPRE